MAKDKALENAQKTWESFTKFSKWGSLGIGIIVIAVILVTY